MSKLTKVSKKNVFVEDIAKITDKQIQVFVEEVLGTFPEYFWTQPASSTGKYHPVCTLGKSGLLVHTKRVIFFGEKLIRAHNWQIGADLSNILMAAFILHDGQKGGKDYGTYEDYENHPLLVEERYRKAFPAKIQDGNTLSTEELDQIFGCIKYHMGPWTPEVVKKPLDKYTELEIIMYHADYMAAQRDLETPIDDKIIKMELIYENK